MPFHFSDKETAKIAANVNGALRGVEAMLSIQDNLDEPFPERERRADAAA